MANGPQNQGGIHLGADVLSEAQACEAILEDLFANGNLSSEARSDIEDLLMQHTEEALRHLEDLGLL